MQAGHRRTGAARLPIPKSLLRQAFAAGWVDDETIWLEMLDARRALESYESLPKYRGVLGKPLVGPQSLSNQ